MSMSIICWFVVSLALGLAPWWITGIQYWFENQKCEHDAREGKFCFKCGMMIG